MCSTPALTMCSCFNYMCCRRHTARREQMKNTIKISDVWYDHCEVLRAYRSAIKGNVNY